MKIKKSLAALVTFLVFSVDFVLLTLLGTDTTRTLIASLCGAMCYILLVLAFNFINKEK